MLNKLLQKFANIIPKLRKGPTIEFFDAGGNLKPQYQTEQFQVYEDRVIPRSVDFQISHSFVASSTTARTWRVMVPPAVER